MTPAHTLAEVVAAGWAPSEHYLIVRLRRGEIRGRKVGRHWLMTDADVERLIEHQANTPAPAAVPAPPVSHIGLSAASAKRRSA